MKSLLCRLTDDPVTENIFKNIPTAGGRFRYLCLTFQDTDSHSLRSMSYQTFLDTIYWQILRDYLIEYRGNKCEKCGCKFKLNIHHQIYKHHGWEHEHLEDLVVYCRLCHQQQHVPRKDIMGVFEMLALKKKIILPPEGKYNPNYDPRAIDEIRRMLNRNEVV